MNRRRKLLPILVVVILIFDVALPSASAHGTYRTSEMGGSLVCDTTGFPGSSDSFTQTGFTSGARHYYITFANDAVPGYSSAVASAQGSATPAAIAPGDILINEVAFKEANDWIEFYVLKAANYEGLRIYYRDGSGVKEFPKITASAGDYIVLHFGDDGTTPDEDDDTGDTNANGYWDIHTTDSGLTGTDNVVRIQRAGTESVHEADTIDAVIWSDNSANFTASQAVASDLVAAGHWDAGATFSEIRDCDAWTDSDDIEAGVAIGRDLSSTDTNSRGDWLLFITQTPGQDNPAPGAPRDILINEVAPGETGEYDWIEFYNGSGSSVDIQYWVVEERTTGIKTFSSYFMAPGEYVVLNLNRDLPDEIMSDVNGNGHRDFYSDDEGLTRTDNVIILRDGLGNVIDAMALANNDGTWASAQHKAFGDVVDANEWVAAVHPNDTEENKRRNEEQCADWSKGGGGESLGRDASHTDSNSKDDWYLFASQTPGVANPTMGTRGDILINEVAPKETNDWIELYNMSGSTTDIRYWIIRERSTIVKTFPSYAVAPGEYFVLNFDGDPANDEVEEDANGNGYRDFYTADSGLVGTDNAIILEDGASTIIDALAFANNDGTWASDQQTAFNNIVNAGHWEGTLDGGAGVNEAESADWSQGDESKSLGRDSASADTNRKADWYLLDYQSPGEVNRFVSARVGTHVQLPCIRNDDGWSTWIQAQNVGITDTGVIVFYWGNYSGLCPSTDPGPIGHACKFVPEDGVWTLKAAIPSAAKSAIAYSVREDKFEAACEKAGKVDNSKEWREWVDKYHEKYPGEPLAVTVNRSGPNDFGTTVSSAYTGVCEKMVGGNHPYGYFVPYAMKAYHGLDTEIVIQNSGQECTSVWIYYRQQGLAGFAYAQHIENLAPGESARTRLPAVPQLNDTDPWLGVAYITAGEPLGIVVDQTSFDLYLGSYDRGTLLSHRAQPWKPPNKTTLYADLVYREFSGWSASIQVQNVSQSALPTFVTVDFMNASGDEILFLGEWIDRDCSKTFYLPAIVDLGLNYLGAAVIRSHDQIRYPDNHESAAQPIVAVVDLKGGGDTEGMDALGGSYNAHSLSEKEWVWNIALPFLAREHQGMTSLIAIRNNSNCNMIKLLVVIKDQAGTVVSQLDEFWLHPKRMRMIDLASIGSVTWGWVGAGEIQVIEVEQLCEDEPKAPVMPSAVVVMRGTGPGDTTGVYAGIPVNIP